MNAIGQLIIWADVLSLGGFASLATAGAQNKSNKFYEYLIRRH